MKSSLARVKLQVKQSPLHGFGVFADEDILTEQLIEECHVLQTDVDDPHLRNYYFQIGDKRGVALGYGSLYNHSDQPNGKYVMDEEHSTCTFTALRGIKQGEEILVSYGENWFSSRQATPKQYSLRYRIRKLLKANLLVVRFIVVASALIGILEISSKLTG